MTNLSERPAAQRPGTREFICIMAALGALEAFSTDAMLPALDEIGVALAAEGNRAQLIIGAIFLGAAPGQFISGALSDMVGRRRSIFAFLVVFVAGTFLCIAAEDFQTMLLGRLLQGFGSAGPYTVSFAIIRDRFEGRDMARISSFVLSVFILVPVVAPLIGQVILTIADWRAIFLVLLGFAALLALWFGLRQPETLTPADRRVFAPRQLLRTCAEILRVRVVLASIAMAGLMLGAFIGYLSSAQPLFRGIYGFDESFPLVFAALSISIAAAGLVNGRLVTRVGMRGMIGFAFVTLIVASLVFLAIATGGPVPFFVTFAYLAVAVFCFGLCFGNIGALAMEPLGHHAGMGATLFGGVSTLIAAPIGALIGQSLDGTVVPLAVGFLVCAALAFAVLRIVLGNR